MSNQEIDTWNFQRMKCQSCPFARTCEVRKKQRIVNRAQQCFWVHDNDNSVNGKQFRKLLSTHIERHARKSSDDVYKAKCEKLRAETAQLRAENERRIKELEKSIQKINEDSSYLFLPFDMSKEKHDPCGICKHFATCAKKKCSFPVRKIICKLFPAIQQEFETLVINWQPMKEKPLPFFPN